MINKIKTFLNVFSQKNTKVSQKGVMFLSIVDETQCQRMEIITQFAQLPLIWFP